MAMGAALCACFKSANSPRDAPSQSVLAGRRDLREGGRQMGLPVSRRRFCRRNDRIHAVAQARSDRGEAVPAPRVIGRRALAACHQRGWHPAYASAIAGLKQSGELGRRCHGRTARYLNNIIEQDHRFIKKRITASLGFRSADGAWRTIEGYEAMHAIRKGQVRWVGKADPVSPAPIHPHNLRHRRIAFGWPVTSPPLHALLFATEPSRQRRDNLLVVPGALLAEDVPANPVSDAPVKKY